MRGLLAKLVNGEITRRQFAERILGAGFGVVTAESILDTVAVAQDKKKAPPVHRRETFHVEPFSEKILYEQWMEHEGVPIHTGYHVADARARRRWAHASFRKNEHAQRRRPHRI
jgi:hypothetical protein